MVVADLHCHTTNSDGTLTLETLPEAAAAADLEAVAVTDHDRLHPDLSAPVVELGADGTALDGPGESAVTVIHGIELRVEPEGGERVDLLGYGARRTGALTDVIEWMQEARVERGRAIVERVEDRLGVELGVTVEEGFGRPHVARAVEAHPEVGLDYEGAFDELIGNGGPCYVRRPVPSFERGVDVLREACGLVGLAHPLRYDDPGAALDLTAELDAVERYYDYGRDVDPAPVERAVRERDLVPTGGSDAHDERLGLAGLDATGYERVRAALA